MDTKLNTVKYSCLLLCIFIICQSCATLKDHQFDHTPLNTNNLKKLNDKYYAKSIITDSIELNYMFTPDNFFRETDRKDSVRIYNSNIYNYVFEIDVVSSRLIRVNYYKKNQLLYKRSYKCKLADDGYLYLYNQNTRLLGVPYLLGALDVKHTRLGLDHNNQLIMDVAYFRGGAALLIIFLAWGNEKYRATYRRLE